MRKNIDELGLRDFLTSEVVPTHHVCDTEVISARGYRDAVVGSEKPHLIHRHLVEAFVRRAFVERHLLGHGVQVRRCELVRLDRGDFRRTRGHFVLQKPPRMPDALDLPRRVLMWIHNDGPGVMRLRTTRVIRVVRCAP